MSPSRNDDWYEHKARLPGPSAPRAKGRRPFGASWWGAAWVEALERRAQLDPNRLPRGRTYARTGAVGALTLSAGEISADVQGSRPSPYKVRVRVRQFDTTEWDRVLDALSAQIGHTAALLDGELLPEVAADVTSIGLDLLPGAGEVQPRCSCPDWADPCKHAAAVCYLVADALDDDPFGVLLLRGLGRDEVLSGLRARRHGTASPSSPLTSLEPAADPGVLAKKAWSDRARGDANLSVTATRVVLPRRPGRPTVLAQDPPTGSGVDLAALRLLASDAAARALALAQGASSTGLELDVEEDLARRAVSMLPGADAAAGTDGTASASSFEELARRAGLRGRELLWRALAYRDGGAEGLAVLQGSFDPSAAEVAVGRGLLGPGASVRHNRVTLGQRQIRLGRDGRWYPFCKDRSGQWRPDGAPTSVRPAEDDLGAVAGDEDPAPDRGAPTAFAAGAPDD